MQHLHKNNKNLYKTNRLEPFSRAFLVFVMVTLISIPLISAFNFDNVKNELKNNNDNSVSVGNRNIPYNQLWEKYKPIKIDNAFGLGKTLFEGAITEHTESCGSECSSTLEVSLEDDGVLIEDIMFETINKDGTRDERELSYQIYIIKNKNEKRYTIGEEVKAGEYTIRIEGQKGLFEDVDWIINTNGEWLEEWAVWTSGLNGNLATYYTANATSGLVLKDDIDGSNNLTLYEMAGNTSNWKAGLIGNAINFEGVNETANGTIEGLPTGDIDSDITVSLWFYQTSASKTNLFTLTDNSLGTVNKELWVGWNGGNLYGSYTGIGNELIIGSYTPTLNTWHHLVVSSTTGGNITIWINNTIVGSDVVGSPTFNIETLYLGWSTFGYYEGMIDEVGVWNRALTLSEISDLYNSRTGITYEGFLSTSYNTPSDNYFSSNDIVTFNCSASTIGATIKNISLWTNESGTFQREEITTGLTNSVESAEWNHNLGGDGKYAWNCQSCDTNDDCAFAGLNRTVTVDTTKPEVTITLPPGVVNYGYVGKNETLNWSIVEPNIGTIWYDYNGTNTTVYGLVNGTNFLIEKDNYNLTFYVNDSVGNINTTFFSWRYALFENAKVYSSPIGEDSVQNFVVNVTYDTSIYTLVTSKLNYNGTQYTTTKTSSAPDNLFSKSITIPLATTHQNRSFLWEFTLINGSTTTYLNTSSAGQVVNITNGSIYGKPYTIPFLNFSVFDSGTLESLNATFTATFDYGLSGTGKALSYSDTTEKNSSFSFAFNPPSESFLISGTIYYGATGYETQIYNLPEQTITNVTTVVNLYLLNTTDSTTFVIKVRDSSFEDVPGATVNIQRYYPGTGTWATTEVVVTNYDGKAYGHFESEEFLYRFLVYRNGELELMSSATKIFCEVSPCTVTLTLPSGEEFASYRNLTGFDYTLLYSQVTETFTYSYIDSDSTTLGGNLRVVVINYGNSTTLTICNESSTSGSAVLTCDLSSYGNGTYIAYGFSNRVDSLNKLIDTVIITKGKSIIASIGLDGVLWSVFLLMGIVMLGLYKPAVAIVLTVFGVIIISWMGLMVIPILSLSAIVFIGVILLWEMRS